MLSVTGFEPTAVQGETAILGLRLGISVWPFALQMAALGGLLWFSLDEATYRRAREAGPEASGS